MNSRKEKIEELIEAIGELKRNITFCPAGIGKRASLTPSQWRALTAIELGKGATTKDLARELGITSSATTQVVDALVVNGYVTREAQKEDRRMVTLVLSGKTKKLVEEMKKQVLENFTNLFKDLNERELDQFILLNKKIGQHYIKI
ncbi:hypothetical protein AUJ77_03290 [Candidatus Nomurabacteria bacterium CG1_02_43_90]|uniref:HTH marR-type domain-containing protein n=1 Tax=Candidatus Nomurabacteria bacterium CG1_02_43_90 TaxID=1805281 RepID=A0A1J4V7X0_9BACT|nr:MAG: hypothetical protein AUJ77_03290 [Candidatus Nomurabacteria bacterium CG1_02_43_90]